MVAAETLESEPGVGLGSGTGAENPVPDPTFTFLQSIVKMLRDDLNRRFDIDREMVHELRETREVHLKMTEVLCEMRDELKHIRMKGTPP
jgi:hypothetical protein